MIKLSVLQTDALTEIVNIGVGKAVSLFNDMLNTHILLEIPKIEFYNFNEFEQISAKFKVQNLVSVSQPFEGEFDGKSALVFHQESAAQLVGALIDEEEDEQDLDLLKSGTFLEVGNIINNALLGTISNFFKCNLDFSLPEYRECEFKKLIEESYESKEENNGVILLGEVNFFIESLQTNGFLVLFFELSSTENLIKFLDVAIEELG